MCLVNGGEGVGMGYSSFVPPHNPREVIENVKRVLKGEPTIELKPWYRGWNGTVECKTQDKKKSFVVKGKIDRMPDGKYCIRELPPGYSTAKYKTMVLDKLKAKGVLVSPIEGETADDQVFYGFYMDKTKEIEDKDGLVAMFKLSATVHTSNMTMFTPNKTIKKYETVGQIEQEFYEFRLPFYEKRKELLIKQMSGECTKLANRARFIRMVVQSSDKEFSIKKIPKQTLLKVLCDQKFDFFYLKKKKEKEQEVSNPVEKGYDYLLSMPLWSLTLEKVTKLEGEAEEVKKKLSVLQNTTAKQMWMADLDELLQKLDESDLQRQKDRQIVVPKKRKKN
jgi:DNA topoisomerase-2